jgi:hypothetical protein
MIRRNFDIALLGIAALLVVQTSLASVGVRFVRDVAVRTHDRLVAVASVGR